MPYTMQQYKDEIANRLSRYQVSLELDSGTLEMIINTARRDVQMATLQLYPERYAAIMTLDKLTGNTATEVTKYRKTITLRNATTFTSKVYVMDLPDEYMSHEVVMVNGTVGAASGFWEAREVNKRELMSALDNINTRPKENDALYYIEKDPGAARHKIYISKGTNAITPADVQIWYTKALKYLELFDSSGNPDVESSIGYVFDEFVVYQSMLISLSEISFSGGAKEVIQNDFEKLAAIHETNYSAMINRQNLLLPTREGQYPHIPVVQVPNAAAANFGGGN